MNTLYYDEAYRVRWVSAAMFLSTGTDENGHYYIGQIVEPYYVDLIAVDMAPADGFYVIVWKADNPEEKELCGPYTSFAACKRRITRLTNSVDCIQIAGRVGRPGHISFTGLPAILAKHLERTEQFSDWFSCKELWEQSCGSITPEQLLKEAEGQLRECGQEGTPAHAAPPGQKRALMKYVARLQAALIKVGDV